MQDLEDVLRFLESPEGEKRIEELIRKMVEEDAARFREATAYVDTKDFYSDLNKVLNMKLPPKEHVELAEKVVSAVFVAKRNVLPVLEEEDATFPTSYIDYQGYRFCITYGQGSFHYIEELT